MDSTRQSDEKAKELREKVAAEKKKGTREGQNEINKLKEIKASY